MDGQRASDIYWRFLVCVSSLLIIFLEHRRQNLLLFEREIGFLRAMTREVLMIGVGPKWNSRPFCSFPLNLCEEFALGWKGGLRAFCRGSIFFLSVGQGKKAIGGMLPITFWCAEKRRIVCFPPSVRMGNRHTSFLLQTQNLMMWLVYMHGSDSQGLV